MFGVRVFVAQTMSTLSIYLFMQSYALPNFLGENLGFFGGNFPPPDVPRINPGLNGSYVLQLYKSQTLQATMKLKWSCTHTFYE